MKANIGTKMATKCAKKTRQISHTNRRLVPGDIVTIIMENSGIYKKHCVQMVYNGDGLGSVLCVCACFLKATPARITRAVSKHSATM